MSSTAPLQVIGDQSIDEKTVNIHPNDGFDLGLMTTEYVVRIHIGTATNPDELPDDAFIYGKIHLKNEVRHACVEMSVRSAEKLGSRKATVHYFKGDRYGTLLISPA